MTAEISKPAIEVKNLVKQFGPIRAVSDISFTGILTLLQLFQDLDRFFRIPVENKPEIDGVSDQIFMPSCEILHQRWQAICGMV